MNNYESEPAGKEQTFIERLLDEQRKLNEKTSDLAEFLSNPMSPKVSNRQKALLEIQFEHMKDYASCLNLRINDLKINQ